MTTFSSEQLNFFKFSTVVLDEFPVALRQVFVYMWDNQVAPIPGFQKWDDSPLVRNMYLNTEGGKTKYVPTSQSFMEWDCTALFEATLHAQSFAMPDGKGGFATLDKLYVKPRCLPKGAFHHSVLSPSGNQSETFALSLDQLRLLRNSLCHQISTQKIDKATFDHYILLAKGAFTALGQNSKKIDDVGKLGVKDFPTARFQQLEEELRREKFKQIEDNLDQIETEVKYVGSDAKDIKIVVTNVKIKVEEVGSDVKTTATNVTTKVEEVWSDVKTAVTDVQTKVEEVGSDVKTAVTDVKSAVEEVGSDIKTAVTDVKTKVKDVGSDLKTAVTEVKTNVEEVGSDVKTAVTDVKTKVEEVQSDVKTAVTDVKTKVEEVRSDVETAVTDVKTKVKDVGSDVKTAVTDVKTTVEVLRSELTKVKANIDDIKQVMQTGTSKGAFVPDSCIPDKIPNFVGRQEECEAIQDHLTDGITRLVNVWGPPGFGKTSVAINIAHHLRDMNIPVYFAPVRGMESKEELVSKLLSIFADDTQVRHISSSHWLIQCLQQVQNPFVLILDNADDLLESGDAKRKQHVLRFIDEILAHCKHIRLLLTTRESLDYLNHTLPMHLEKINVLDDVSSASLVRLLLPDTSEDDRSCIVRECGKVPLSVQLMCSIMREENISIYELSEELKNSTLVEVLDNESFPDDARLKTIINTSFQRLTSCERSAFVTLSVFPGWFRIEEATAVLGRKTDLATKKIIRSLERKSVIDCGDNFSLFSIHSLFRSFIDEERKNDQVVGTTFLNAQLHFYNYYISSFQVTNENVLRGHYTAFRDFLDRRECILLSLTNGPRNDEVYPKAVEVLSKAELFLCVVLHGEELLFDHLYDIAVEEAKRRQNMVDKRRLLSAKSFRHWSCFSSDTACSYHWFGVVQRQTGDLSGALKSVQVALRLRKELLGEHPDTAVSFHEQGLIHFYMYDNKSAVKAFQKAADINSTLLGDHKYTACSYHSLGLAQREMGGQKEALESLQKAADMRLNLLDDHKDTACSYHWLGVVQREMGDHKKALESLRKASDMRLNLLDDHKDTACSYHILALVQRDLTDNKGALKSIEKAADMRSHLLGDHEDTARSYHVLSVVQRQTEDLSGALKSVEVALRMRKELLGDHPDTAASFHEKGLIHFYKNDHASAVEAFQKAAGMNSTLFGDSKYTAYSYHSLGVVQREMGNHKEALESLQKAADMRSNLLGHHKDTACSYHWLGLVQRDLIDIKGALKSLQKAVDIRSSLLGDHKDTACSYHWFGVVQRQTGDLSGALESVQVALRLRKELLGDHSDTAVSFHEQGLIHFYKNDNKSAVKAFQKAADINSDLRGDHKYTACCYHNLAKAQRRSGEHKRARESLQKAVDITSNLSGNHKDSACSYHSLGLVKRVDALQEAADINSNLLADHRDTV